jgi:hypothetical protein
MELSRRLRVWRKQHFGGFFHHIYFCQLLGKKDFTPAVLPSHLYLDIDLRMMQHIISNCLKKLTKEINFCYSFVRKVLVGAYPMVLYCVLRNVRQT